MRGLALSGGGFRATLFHLGSLWRLNELALLASLDEISSVPGGSILAGHLGLHWTDLEFIGGVAVNYREVIVKPIMQFCSRTTDVGVILGGILSPFVYPGELLVRQYRRRLYGRRTLQDLPAPGCGPQFTICATSMQTGASVRLTRAAIREYHLGEIPAPEAELSRVVAASSAFPPPLCPVTLQVDPGRWKELVGADCFRRDALKTTMYLTDGGVYDNLGLESLKTCETVFVSDAGVPPGNNGKAALGSLEHAGTDQTDPGHHGRPSSGASPA